MTRYFFHVKDGHDMPDLVGTELPDLVSVRGQALRTSGELLRDFGDSFWNHGEWIMTVVDEAGNEVLALTFEARQTAAHRKRTSASA